MFSDKTKARIRKWLHDLDVFLFQINCMHRQRRDINQMEFYCPRCKGTFLSDQI